MLDQVRKYQVFTVLAHQRFGQLNEDLADAVLTNCRIKAVFGGLPVESAKRMAEELFIGELDPLKIKVAIYQTKFWPKYSRDKVYSKSRSSGTASGSGENVATSVASGSGSGEYFLPAEWFSSPELTGTSVSESRVTSEVSGHHSSYTEFEGDAEGEADIPIMLPVPFRELSSVQYFTTDEQLIQLTAALKEQFQRHCFVKVHDQKTQPMLVPFVKRFYTSPKNLAWYEERILAGCRAMPRALLDAAGSEQAADSTAKGLKKKETVPRNSLKRSWEDLIGKE